MSACRAGKNVTEENRRSDAGGHVVHPAKRTRAQLNPSCFVCGAQNPRGLQIVFQHDPSGVQARWQPGKDWESFRGVIHGGIITTVLDEAMSKAVIAKGWEALTVDIRTRLRAQVTPGDALDIRGWVVSKRGRRILAEACLSTQSGEESAHAWATFLVPPAGRT